MHNDEPPNETEPNGDSPTENERSKPTSIHDRVVIRAKDFRKTFGIANSTRADWENPRSPRFDKSFPKKIPLGFRCVGYLYDEVMAWLESRRQK